MSSTQPKPGDMSAAFIGLIVGTIALLLILFGTMKWTESRFAGHGETPAATTAH